MTEDKKSLVDRIWDIFASVKLAIVLIALIALSSIVGTVLEQGGDPGKNIIVLEKLFGKTIAPPAYRLFESLGFMEMYHSWWFVTFLVLFTANLIICSLDRLPRILKLVTEPVKPLKPEQFNSFSIKKEVTLKGKPEAVKEQLQKLLKSAGFKSMNSPMEDGGYQLYSGKGSWTRLGVYITHLSILVILAGAVTGIFFGFKGFLNLPEGYTSDVVYSRNGQAQQLDFSLRCDDFDVEYYGFSDMPKDYRSWLTIIKDGKEVTRKMIEVNEPLKYGGYTFYQSSYGMVPNAQGYFVFRVIGPDRKTETIYKRFGESLKIPGTGITASIKEFSPALSTDASGRPYTYADMMNNPAVFVEFTEGGAVKYSGWILKRYPKTWQLPGNNTLEFIDYWGAQYTGLQVRKEPTVWIVYLGCIIMGAGLYIAFFMSHRKVWVVVRDDGKSSRVTLVASSNKNRASLERKIENLASRLAGSA